MDHAKQEITVSLISELDELTGTTKGSKTKKSALLPTPSQLYRVGGVLSSIVSSSSSPDNNNKKQEIELVRDAYQQIVSSLPRSHFEQCFRIYQNAMKMLTNRVAAVVTTSIADNKDIGSLIEAVRSLRGLLSNSEQACQIAYSTDFVSILASIHDQTLRLKSSSPSSPDLETSQREILQCLSHLFVDGCLAIKSNESQKERHEQQPIEQRMMHAFQAMEEQSTDTLSILLEWQEQNETPQRQLEHALLEYHKACSILTGGEGDTTQLEYLVQMLGTARLDRSRRNQGVVDQSHSKPPKQAKASFPSKPVSAADELDRRIDQVQQVLPDLGAGFIETALSYYQGNVETTVSMLLSGVETDLPPALRLIDRQLPRRQKQSNRSKDDAVSAAEAKQIVKDRVALEQQQEQEKYKALLYVSQEEQQQQQQASGQADTNSAIFTHAEMMYDDDVDDQYDDIDGGLGGADSGWYDFEKVKLYNQAVKDEETDQLFWEENRNTNRPAKKTNGSSSNAQQGEGQGKQYRGPDKIKGGRIIGPDGKVVKNSGGRGRKQQQQRRQANNNNNAAAPGGGTGGGNGPSQQQPKKPKTKPKSNNRVNQRRDRKQKAQGTFGVND